MLNIFVDALNLWRIDKGTLYTDGFSTIAIEHITTTDKLVGTCLVEDGHRVDAGTHTEGDTSWEVSFDITGDDLGRRSLCGDDHVYTHGTCQLSDTCNRLLDLFSSGHDQVTKLIDDHHDIWHVFMSVGVS